MDTPTIPCTVANCGRIQYRNTFCRRHHYRLKMHGDPLGGGPFRNTEHAEACAMPSCTRPYVAMGLCGTHYQRRALHGDPLYQRRFAKDEPCTVRGCIALQAAKGFCNKHYTRYLK